MLKAFTTAIGVALLCAGAVHAAEIGTFPDKDTPIIYVNGEIKRGDEDAFRREALAHPDAFVALASPGGDVETALEIGRIISINRQITMVISDRECASACALVWLAGSSRAIQEGGRVGFHAGWRSEGGRPVADSAANAVIGGYLNSLNLSRAAIIFATSAAPEGMAWLDTTRPGTEGISYDVFPRSDDKDPPAAAAMSGAAPPPIQTVGTSRVASGTRYGRWEVVTKTGYAGIVTESIRGGDYLAFICPKGQPCRYALKPALACEPGDGYRIEVRLDAYKPNVIGLTCSAQGDFLYIDEPAAFDEYVSGETGITFTTKSQTGKDVEMRFILIGLAEGMKSLRTAGYMGEGQ